MAKEKTQPNNIAEVHAEILGIERGDLRLGGEQMVLLQFKKILKKMVELLDPAALLEATNMLLYRLHDIATKEFKSSFISLLCQDPDAHRWARIVWAAVIDYQKTTKIKPN